MKKLLFMAVSVVLIAAIACKPAETKAVVEIPAPLFKAMVVRFPVSDYNKWKMHFLEGDSMRTAHNISNIGYGRGTQDTNTVIVIHRITDMAQAKTFMTSPEVKMAMDSAGVTGQPTVDYVDVLRNDSSETTITDRLMVKHAVNDVSAWFQAYDGEGVDVRKSHGLIDRAVSRDLQDSSVIAVVFAVSDLEKAMARSKSEELKKLMQEAGVKGEPEFFAYRFEFLDE